MSEEKNENLFEKKEQETVLKTDEIKDLSLSEIALKKQQEIDNHNKEIHERASKIAGFHNLKNEYEKTSPEMSLLFESYEYLLNNRSSDFYKQFEDIEKNILKIAISKESDERIKGKTFSTLSNLKEYQALLKGLDEEEAKRKELLNLDNSLPDPSKMNVFEKYNHIVKNHIQKRKEALKFKHN